MKIQYENQSYTPKLPKCCPSHPNLKKVWLELMESLGALIDQYILKPTKDLFRAVIWFDTYALCELVRFEKVPDMVIDSDSKKALKKADYRRRNEINAAPSSHNLETYQKSNVTSIADLMDQRRRELGKKRHKKRA